MYRTIAIMTACLAALFAGACATAPQEQETLEQKLAERDYRVVEEIDRIRDYRIDGWYYVDDYHVVFRGGPSDYYLLTLQQRCVNLRGAHRIAFSTTVGRVTRFDNLLVHDGTGLPAERCLIEKIHRVEKTA